MTATFWQSGLRLSEAVQLVEDQRLSLVSSSAEGFLTQEAVILSDGIPLDTFDANAFNQGETSVRAQFSAALASASAMFAPIFTELGKVINQTGSGAASSTSTGVPPTAATSVIPLLYQFMANSNTTPNTAGFASAPLVQSRNLTRGTATAASGNVGNGAIYRLTVDRFGFPIENDFAETVTFQVTADNQTGTLPGQEQFLVQGQPFRDALTWFAAGYGSGLVAPGGLTGVTGDTTTALIQNPSFSQFSGTAAAPTAITSWTFTAGSVSDVQVDQVNYYRACAIEGSSPASLEFTASATITQQIAPNNTAGQLALTAYLERLAWNGSIGSWSGSMTVTVGTKSVSVSSGASGWQLLLRTLNKNLWAQNFEEAGLAVTIAVTVVSGTARIDDFCWSAFTSVGGKLFWAGGGSTNWIVNDSFQAVDSEPSTPSKVQNWIRLMFPGYWLPSAVLPAAPVAAATLANSGSGTTVTNGGHVGYVTFVTAAGESALGPASNIAQTVSGNSISWTGIPTGPGGTTARGIYRTRALTGGVGSASAASAQPYLVAYIANNSATTYTDSVADGSLTLQPGTIGDPVN